MTAQAVFCFPRSILADSAPLRYTMNMFDPFFALFDNPVFHVIGLVFGLISWTAFIWAPILLVWLAAMLWLEYRQLLYIRKNFEFIMLEVRVPRIVDKTPVAMELVLHAFQQGSKGNWYDRWWGGQVKPWFSLEMVSLEGAVKFFIRTPSKFKKTIETHIYAQYPDIEVHEVKDYVSLAPYLHEKGEWSMNGCTYTLTKPDPYPIKTYVDYKLDSTQTKEEQKSDPISNIIEFLGSIGRHQYVWLQILIQTNNERYSTAGTWFGKHDWKQEGKNLVKEIQDKYAGDGAGKMSKRESEAMAAIERSISKPGFDCGIRGIYIGKKEHYDGSNVGALRGIFQAFSSHDLNGFKANGTGFDYPWQDYKDWRVNKQKHKLYDGYVRRSYFAGPYRKKPFVLNTEELATIFHFPGGVAETPTFTRIESRKGEPPANLPI